MERYTRPQYAESSYFRNHPLKRPSPALVGYSFLKKISLSCKHQIKLLDENFHHHIGIINKAA